MDMNRSGLSGIQQCRMSNFFGLLLTVTAILAVLPYNGVICDGQIVSRWICAGIAFCVTVPILSVCGLSVSKDSLQTDFVWICISFALSFAIVLVHSNDTNHETVPQKFFHWCCGSHGVRFLCRLPICL